MTVADAVVVGGGPAGSAAALSLAIAGRSVVMVTRGDNYPVGEMLCPEVRIMLAQLGVWEEFLGGNPSPAHGIWSAWGSDRLVARDFIANPYGTGWFVDRR